MLPSRQRNEEALAAVVGSLRHDSEADCALLDEERRIAAAAVDEGAVFVRHAALDERRSAE